MVPLRLICASLIALSVITACSVTGKGGFCSISESLRLSAATVDAMTDTEVKAALSHNRKGQKLCGWTQ